MFDGADVIGISWNADTSAPDARLTDVDSLRWWADHFEAEMPEEAVRTPVLVLRSAADEVLALRLEVIALKKGLAAHARKIAALQKAAAGEGLGLESGEAA